VDSIPSDQPIRFDELLSFGELEKVQFQNEGGPLPSFQLQPAQTMTAVQTKRTTMYICSGEPRQHPKAQMVRPKSNMQNII
jgi:hypothetical protein